jgi:hypothetical protein
VEVQREVAPEEVIGVSTVAAGGRTFKEVLVVKPVLGVDKGNEEVTGGSKAVRDVVWEVETEAKMVSKLSNAVVDL